MNDDDFELMFGALEQSEEDSDDQRSSPESSNISDDDTTQNTLNSSSSNTTKSRTKSNSKSSTSRRSRTKKLTPGEQKVRDKERRKDKTKTMQGHNKRGDKALVAMRPLFKLENFSRGNVHGLLGTRDNENEWIPATRKPLFWPTQKILLRDVSEFHEYCGRKYVLTKWRHQTNKKKVPAHSRDVTVKRIQVQHCDNTVLPKNKSKNQISMNMIMLPNAVREAYRMVFRCPCENCTFVLSAKGDLIEGRWGVGIYVAHSCPEQFSTMLQRNQVHGEQITHTKQSSASTSSSENDSASSSTSSSTSSTRTTKYKGSASKGSDTVSFIFSLNLKTPACIDTY